MNDTFTGAYNQPFTPSAVQRIILNDTSPNAAPKIDVVEAGPPDSGNLTAWFPNGTFVWVPAASFSGEGRGFGGGVSCRAPAKVGDARMGGRSLRPASIKPALPTLHHGCMHFTALPSQARLCFPTRSRTPARASTRPPTCTSSSRRLHHRAPLRLGEPLHAWVSGPTQSACCLLSRYQDAPSRPLLAQHAALRKPLSLLACPRNFTYRAPYGRPFRPNGTTSQPLLIVLANSTNPGPMTAVNVTAPPPPGDGSVTLEPNGSFTWTPPPGWYGEWRAACSARSCSWHPLAAGPQLAAGMVTKPGKAHVHEQPCAAAAHLASPQYRHNASAACRQHRVLC